MRKLLIALIVFLFAAPSLGRWIDTPGDVTKSDLTVRIPNKFVTGVCIDKIDFSRALCGGFFLGKSFVEFGICTEEQAVTGVLLKDVHTQKCTQNRIDKGVCQAEWIGTDLEARKVDCRKLASKWIRFVIREAGAAGLARGDDSRKPQPSNHGGEVEDP